MDLAAKETEVAEPEKTELAERSDELLDALQRLKDTERRKRHEPISSDTFHRLANEVDAVSHEVFSIARDERSIGERTPRGDESIEDVEDERRA
jgi:hypothetical protein